MTGRLLSTHLPQRQGCRISDFYFPASNGLAGNPHTREATPIHPGLVSLPGSQSIFDTPDVADQPGRSSLRRATSGCVLGRSRIFISLGRELGGDTAQDFTKRFERLRSVGLRHAQQSGDIHVRASEQVVRVSGEVCRECGF